jgi:hypothetical protein
LKNKSLGRYLLEYFLSYGAIVVILLYKNIHAGLTELVLIPSFLSLLIVIMLNYFSKPLRRYLRKKSDPRFKSASPKKNSPTTPNPSSNNKENSK